MIEPQTPAQPLAAGFLFHASIDYTGNTRLREMEEEEWEAFRAKLRPGRIPTFDKRGGYFSVSDWICDLEEAQVWTDAGFMIEVHRIKGVAYPVHPSNVLRETLNGQPPTIVNVSVSNVGLFDVRTVHYEEDCCTDALQSYLDDGWRILAVCPPNDQRRPTYIIGHAEPGKRA